MAKRDRRKRRAPDQTRRQSAPALVDRQSRRVDAARRLWAEGRRNDALALYREAMRQEPDNVRTYIAAARALAERFDFEQMEQVHQRLLRRDPRHPGVYHAIGETYVLLKLPERAAASFQQAAALPGMLPPTSTELASLYEASHRLDEASALIEKAVSQGFDLPSAWLIRGRIERRLGRSGEAESLFRQLIEKSPDTPWACQAWGEIALMKDRQGDYAAAVEAIEHCKQFQLAREKRYWKASEKVHRRMETAARELTANLLRRWRDESPSTTERVALLSGFPRSGTTLLEQVLDAHPGLVSSEERDFIGQEAVYALTAKQRDKTMLHALDAAAPSQIAALRQRYFAAMDYLRGEPLGDRIHLDKNPAYNLMLPVALRLFPEIRLVIALRDPRDVVLSCYLRYLPLNSVSVRFLTPLRTAERYALDMSTWLAMRELVDVPWRQVRYEDTVRDIQRQARRVFSMLDLPWHDDVLQYRSRLGQEKRVTSPTYEAVAEPVYTRAIGRWQNYEALLAPTLSTLAPFIKEFGYD